MILKSYVENREQTKCFAFFNSFRDFLINRECMTVLILFKQFANFDTEFCLNWDLRIELIRQFIDKTSKFELKNFRWKAIIVLYSRRVPIC